MVPPGPPRYRGARMRNHRPTGWGGEPVAAPTLAELQRAAEWLDGRVVRTPLLRLADDASAPIFLKPEVLQPIGSYKLRGALYWAHRLPAEARGRGLLTCSAGNTAQALGYAAREYGVTACSNLPDSLPDNKLAAIRGYGIEPVRMPLEQLILYMLEERWRDDPRCYLNPWGDADMIAGNGTIGLEIAEDLPAVDTVFVPVGGGGLIAGVGAALRLRCPRARIVAVQSAASPALARCFERGAPVWVESRPTWCEGTSVPVVVDEMLPLLRSVIDEVVTVEDGPVRGMIRRLALDHKLVVEGSGAIAAAAAVAAGGTRGTSVCILSGGSLSAARLIEALSTSES